MRAYLKQKNQTKSPTPAFTPTPEPTESKDGFFKSVVKGIAKPFAKAATSGLRAIQAIPDAASAVSKAVQGKDFSADLTRGESTLATPMNVPGLGSVKTFEGSSSKEILGDAFQYGANVIPVARGAGMFASGAVGAGGQALSEGGSYTDAAKSAAFGGLLNRYAPTLLKGAYKQLPQSIKNPISGAVNAVATKLNSAASKATAPVTNQVSKLVAPKIKQTLVEDYGKMLNLGQVARNFETKTGKNAASFLVDEGIPLNVAKREGRYVLDAEEGLQVARQTASQANNLFSNLLEGQYKYFKVDDIENAALKNLTLTGLDRKAGERYVREQLYALVQQNADDAYRETGQLLHAAKWNRVKQGAYSPVNWADPTSTIKNDANRAIGKAVKDAIETIDDVKIKEINNYLGNWSDAIYKLADRNGKDVRMSRLGRYFNRLGGATIGTSAGGVLGGIGGAMIADTLTDTLTNPGISSQAKQKILQRLGATPEGKQVIQMIRQKLGAQFDQLIFTKALPKAKTVNYTPNVLESNQNAYGVPSKGKADTIIAGSPTSLGQVSSKR